MERKCIICSGELLKVVSDKSISAEATYTHDFFISTCTDKYVCTECGYIQEYARNPKVFTDSKYRNMELEERSNGK